MKQRLLIYTLLLVVAPWAMADDIRFYVSGPSQVEKGKLFQVEYVVEGTDKGNIKLPAFEGCAELYSSPSVMRSTRIINGKRTDNITKKQTVSLRADSEGTFTFGPATFVHNGKEYTTKSHTFTVVPAVQHNNNAGGNNSRNRNNNGIAPATPKTEIFMRWVLSKSKVYQGEAITATLRLYSTSHNISNSGITLPSFEGFVSQRVDVNNQWKFDTYDNKQYYVADIYKTILFPQQAGDLVISEGKANYDVPVVVGYAGFGFPITDVVNESVLIPSIKVNVKPTPQPAPASYTGGVGVFTIKSEVSDTHIKANEALTYTLTVDGKGNLEMMSTPELQLSSEFDLYDPQVTLDIQSNGLSGKRTMEYVLVPRYAGTFTIPALEIAYFNTNTGKYETHTTEAYTIEVEPGDNNSSVVVNKYNDNAQTGFVQVADIRPIKSHEGKLLKAHKNYISDFSYWLWYIIPILLVVVAMIAHRAYISSHADVVAYRNRKANAVALRRLKKAGKHLKAKDEKLFYEEVLRAVWGYLGDKLAMPTSELSRENIQSKLQQYGLDDTLIEQFTQVIDTCEFARYAPASAGDAMSEVYQNTLYTMSEMENVIKTKKSKK